MGWDNCHKIVLRNLGSDQPTGLHSITRENANAESDLGTTPLHFAALSANCILLEVLLSKGARINTSNDFGETPLHWSCKNGVLELVTFLLQHGADGAVRDADGNYPLHWAAEYENNAVLEYLLEQGPKNDINLKNADEETLLETACFWGNPSTVELLLSKGADIGSGLLIAMKHGYSDVAEVIRGFITVGKPRKLDPSVVGRVSKAESLQTLSRSGNSALKQSETLRKYSKALAADSPDKKLEKREKRQKELTKVKKRKKPKKPFKSKSPDTLTVKRPSRSSMRASL